MLVVRGRTLLVHRYSPPIGKTLADVELGDRVVLCCGRMKPFERTFPVLRGSPTLLQGDRQAAKCGYVAVAVVTLLLLLLLLFLVMVTAG